MPWATECVRCCVRRHRSRLNMDTYYIRHTQAMDVDDAMRQRLWKERRIAIHFPHDKGGKLPKRDNASLDLADYPRGGRKAMRALLRLSEEGGYVCAEYFRERECILGYVSPASKIDLIHGKWGSIHGYAGREAVLKSLRLEKVKLVSPNHTAVMLVARPRQGTIMRWKTARETIENIVEGKRIKAALSLLSDKQQEIMCSEFLRSAIAARLGLQKMVHLLLPVGRTMRDIDICGITESGSMVFAQVTYSAVEHCRKKLDALQRYRDEGKNALVFFCNCDEPTEEDGVKIVPLRTVYDTFAASSTGKLWIERATNPI
jgi:hypothetical protein